MINKSISIVFPAYNEADNIKETVLDAYRYAKKNFNDFEVIVVDDGSVDQTSEIVEAISKTKKQIKVLKNKKNMGYGATVWRGLKAARKQLIFFSDADRQFDLREISNILNHIDEHDVVIGYRRNRKDPFLRKLNAWGWKMLIRLTLNLKVRDIDCAFKLFRREVVKSIEVGSTGAMFSAELIYNIKKSGYKVKEIGVSHYPRIAGSPTGAKFSVIKKAFVELWRFYSNDAELVKQKSRYVFWMGAIGLFASRLLLRSNSLDFFDSSEYVWRTNDSSLLKAMATGHPPFHPLYVFFGWLLHHLPFGLSETVSLELTSAILGSLSIIFLFLFIRKLFNSKVAWLSSIIYALFPFVWIGQTTVLVDACEHAFYFLSLYLWFLALEAKAFKGRYLALLAGLSFGLAAFAHTQVAIWGIAVVALPIVLIKPTKKDLLELLYKYLIFALGGIVFIYLYVKLLLYSFAIGWQSEPATFRAALKYLILGNVGDHDSVELEKVIYYLGALSSSLVGVLAFFGAAKLSIKSYRKFIFLALWFIPFFIGSTYIYENLYARTLIIGLAPVAVFAAYFILSLKRSKLIWMGLVIVQLVVLGFPAALLYHRVPAPIEHIKEFVSDIKPNGIFISSNVTKTLANAAYQGEYVNFGDVGNGAGYVEEKIKNSLSQNKPVYILSDALILPYRRYDGLFYDLRSTGTGAGSTHLSNLDGIYRNYNLTLSKVEDHAFRRALYQIGNSQQSDYLNDISDSAMKTPIIFGKLKSGDSPISGAIINNYARLACGTVKENITRWDLGFCLTRMLRDEPQNWTFTDKDGWFYLPADSSAVNLKIGSNPGQTRMKGLNGEFASEDIISPNTKYIGDFQSGDEVQKKIDQLDGSFYAVATMDSGVLAYRLFKFDYQLPKTNTIEAKNIMAEAGKIVEDKKIGKKVRISDERLGFMASGPYIDLKAGNCKIVYNLKRSKELSGEYEINISADYGRLELGNATRKISELSQDYQTVELSINPQQDVSGVEFRLRTAPNSGVVLESVQINQI